MKNLCSHCHKREGTEKWLGHGSTLDYVHGFYQMWCLKCCLEAQIEFMTKEIERMKEELPKLKEELKKLIKE